MNTNKNYPLGKQKLFCDHNYYLLRDYSELDTLLETFCKLPIFILTRNQTKPIVTTTMNCKEAIIDYIVKKRIWRQNAQTASSGLKKEGQSQIQFCQLCAPNYHTHTTALKVSILFKGEENCHKCQKITQGIHL